MTPVRRTHWRTFLLCSVVSGSLGLARAELVISEFMAANGSTALDLPGVEGFPDWIELHNRGDESVDLSGWSLTDDPGDLRGFVFSSVVLPSGGYLLVIAGGDASGEASGVPHAPFRLSASGEYLALADPSGAVTSSYGNPDAESPQDQGFPPQYQDISFGLGRQDELQFFVEPTPGRANGNGVAGFVEPVSFSVQRGFFSEPFELTLSCPTPGIRLLYTTDGREPSEGSIFSGPIGEDYTGPIPIATTTSLRARAFLSRHQPSPAAAQTYLFLEHVRAQPLLPEGLPPRWGSESADYGMSQILVDDPAYRDLIDDSLKSLPSILLSTGSDGFFGAARGIYANATQSGPESERGCFVEWLEGDGSTGFAIACGVRAQGGASRNQDRSLKHSLSLRFRQLYGEGKLRYPLFPGSRVEAFDSVQLRAMYNNSWVHSSADQRQRATLIRDQWMRDCMLDLGNETAMRGRYIHLYINGMYWGVHNLHERANADHYAAYHGGTGDDYDAINGGTLSDGTREAYDRMRAVVRSRDWEAIQRVVNIDHFIDFTMLHRFGGNQDLKSDGNWRAAGGGPGDHPWEYYLWDVERVLEDPNNNGIPIPVAEPSGLLADLDDIPDFTIRFFDRIHRAFFNDGPLAVARNQERWSRRTAELELAIIAESARWGGVRRRNQPYSRDVEWRAENRRLLEQYFPARNTVALQNFVNMGFYPRIEAPVFNQHGGEADPGFVLRMTSSSAGGIFSAAKIHYTLDGSDPRLPGGDLDPAALVHESNGVTLTESALVRARVRNTFGAWSALNEAFFRVDAVAPTAENLRVSEIHYNPLPPTVEEFAAGFDSGGAFEFIELFNAGASDLYLGGSAFDVGIAYLFPESSVLKPGSYAIVASNPDALLARHPSSAAAALSGAFRGALDNGGERIRLVDPSGNTILEFSYDDAPPWPAGADGLGYSLTLKSPAGNPDPGEPGSWTTSAILHGTPGGPDSPAPEPDGDVDGDGYPDWVEAYFGSQPQSPGSQPFFEFATEGTGGRVFRYHRATGAAAHPVTLQYSSDLEQWESAARFFRDPVSLDLSDGLTEVSYRENNPGVLPASVFLRLQLERREAD
ncbi:MAG TPA: lamin tail domain-containing protein [Verrucomicrobiales bacterium]|nr:lamin tail domain-containing protein [Verrucomicrobiales bacterium]